MLVLMRKGTDKLKYNNVIKAIFLKRPNRFIAHVLIDGVEAVAHVRNTGRCRELLIPGCTVYLEKSSNQNRKTSYTLISVEKILLDGSVQIVNMDSAAPNNVVEEWLREGNLFGDGAYIKREVVYGDSRFDFYIEHGDRKAFIEVKGVTLEVDGVAMFPDAPTERGVKHLSELCRCVENGYEGYVIFVIKMSGMKYFTPNIQTHPQFAIQLKRSMASGVRVLALECDVTEDSLNIKREITVKL